MLVLLQVAIILWYLWVTAAGDGVPSLRVFLVLVGLETALCLWLFPGGLGAKLAMAVIMIASMAAGAGLAGSRR
jgi:hypothetical protein